MLTAARARSNPRWVSEASPSVMTRLEIRPLVHFLAVIDERTLGRAARRVNLSQPALSKSIRQLEINLGVPLFERGADGMTPTRYSAALVERARLIVQEARHAQDEMDQLCGRVQGSVTICAGPSIVGALLAQAVANLQEFRPGIRVHVIEGMLDMHLPALSNGSADFLIGTATIPAPEGLVAEPLFHDDIQVVSRPAHPIQRQGPVSMAELAAWPWVLTGAAEVLRLALCDRFSLGQTLFPTRITETNSIQFMKSLVMETDHLTYLPRIAITMEETTGLLASVHAPEASYRREVHVLHRARGTLSPAARALLHSIKLVCARRHPGHA